jgi:hypothetical protein
MLYLLHRNIEANVLRNYIPTCIDALWFKHKSINHLSKSVTLRRLIDALHKLRPNDQFLAEFVGSVEEIFSR